MIPAATMATLPAFTNLASWLPDIVDRLARGLINDEEAEAEYRKHAAEFDDELAAARGTIAASRRREDEERKKLPRETPTPAPATPSPPPAPAPGATPGAAPEPNRGGGGD